MVPKPFLLGPPFWNIRIFFNKIKLFSPSPDRIIQTLAHKENITFQPDWKVFFDITEKQFPKFPRALQLFRLCKPFWVAGLNQPPKNDMLKMSASWSANIINTLSLICSQIILLSFSVWRGFFSYQRWILSVASCWRQSGSYSVLSAEKKRAIG